MSLQKKTVNPFSFCPLTLWKHLKMADSNSWWTYKDRCTEIIAKLRCFLRDSVPNNLEVIWLHIKLLEILYYFLSSSLLSCDWLIFKNVQKNQKKNFQACNLELQIWLENLRKKFRMYLWKSCEENIVYKSVPVLCFNGKPFKFFY